jgi:methyl-accepting chemotaxis protein
VWNPDITSQLVNSNNFKGVNRVLSDPITLTVNGVANSLNRISTGDLTSSYSTADESLKTTIKHQRTSSDRIRTTIDVVQRKVVSDPLTSENDYDTLTFRLLIDRPSVGWTATEVDYVNQALAGFLTTANVGKLYGLQS